MILHNTANDNYSKIVANNQSCILLGSQFVVKGRMYTFNIKGSIVKTNKCSNVCFTWFAQLRNNGK